MTVLKAFAPATIVAGSVTLLTITVSNPNIIAMTGITLTDTFPTTPGVGVVRAAIPAAATTCGGGVVTHSAGSVTLTGGTLAATSSCTISIDVTAANGGTYVNNIPVGAVSSSLGSNTAAATAALTVNLPLADVKVVKTGPATVNANGVISYVVTISNLGPGEARDVAVSDVIPAGITGIAVGCGNDVGGAVCAGGTITGNAFAATLVSLPSGGSLQYTVTGTAPATGTFTNTASAITYGSSDPTDPTRVGAGNNSSSVTTTVVFADLQLTKSHVGNFNVDTNGTFTLATKNISTSVPTVGTVTITDTLPVGLTFVSATGTDWTCSALLQVVTCTTNKVVAPLTSAQPITLVVAVLAVAQPSVTNTAVVSGGGESPTTLADNTANDPVVVNGTVATQDLRLSKTHTGSFTVGVNGTFTLTPDNILGALATTGVVTVVDTLPAGLTFVSGAGAGWVCGNLAQVVSCTSSAVIAAGGTGTPITITVAVGAAALPSALNSAVVSGGGEPLANNGNNSAVDTVAVLPAAQNQFLNDGGLTGLPGASVTYPHVFNANVAGNVSFTTADSPTPVLAGWVTTVFRDTNCNGILDGAEAATPLTTSVAVVPGDQVCIIVRNTIPVGAAAGATDTVVVSSNFVPTVGVPQTLIRQDVTTVGAVGGSGLTLQKTVRNITQGGVVGTNNVAKPGDIIEYVITYTNTSTLPVTTIDVLDNTPTFTTFISAACGSPLPTGVTACAVGSTPAVGANGNVQWVMTGSLAAAQSGQVTMRVKVD